MRVIVKEFKRTARRNWCCDKCHKMIPAKAIYQDQEMHYITDMIDGVKSVIKHRRLCAVCAGYVEEHRIYKFKEPEPVMDLTDNMKYLLVGVGYKPGTKDLYLIAKDWLGTKYHWKVCLWTVDGNLLKTSNVEFI